MREQRACSRVADQGRRQHEAGETLAVALGVAGRDQAAHRVAHEDDREVGVLAAGLLDQAVEVVHDGVEVDDQRRLAVRAPMADVVQAMDGGPVRHEGVGHVVVAADVLAVSVRDDHDGGSGPRSPTNARAAIPRVRSVPRARTLSSERRERPD